MRRRAILPAGLMVAVRADRMGSMLSIGNQGQAAALFIASRASSGRKLRGWEFGDGADGGELLANECGGAVSRVGGGRGN